MLKIKKSFIVLTVLLLSISLILLPSCKKEKTPEPEVQAASYYEYFDTVSVIFSYLGDSKEAFDANCQAVATLLEEYHRLFDIYYEYSGVNNLKTINKNAGKEPVKVDPKLIDFLLYAKEIYALTDGATNVAMGSVLKLWHDARENGMDDPENAYLPSPDALTEAAEHTDIETIVIDREAGTVFITDPDVSLDVGALGKGYATERAAELLIARGVTSYVLNIGGNIRAIGTKTTGEGWVTGITNPDKTSNESFVCRVVIQNTSLVTSGDYERYYLVDGVRYHHIIDPATNMPARYFSSISVFCEDSALADALSTALFCKSYEDGRALIDRLDDVGAIWVAPDGEVRMTENVTIYEQE